MLTTYEPGLGTQSSTAPVWCAPPYREWAAQPPRLPRGHSRLPDEYPIREGDKRSDREPLVRQTTGRRPLRKGANPARAGFTGFGDCFEEARGTSFVLLLRSSKAVYINAWPNRRRRKERDYAEAATRSRTPQCRGGVQDPQTGSKPPCSRRLDRQSPHHLFELARVAHRQDR